MRIAVVTIAKNEAAHVERWAASCEGADLALIADTGSTDGTVEIAERLCMVAEIAIAPWRFDDARNAALALVPRSIDWVITLDLDEILTPGWRPRVEEAIARVPGANRLWYPYVWNWRQCPKCSGECGERTPNGGWGEPCPVCAARGVVPGVRFDAHRTHAREGFRWVAPCHETIVRYGPGPIVDARVEGAPLIEHHADDSKPRGSYLELLELALRENPTDKRAALYLLREQLFREHAILGTGRSVVHHLFGRLACSAGFGVEGRAELERAFALASSPEEERLISADLERFGRDCSR